MARPERVADLEGFPYPSFADLQAAIRAGEAVFGVDRTIAYGLVSEGYISRPAYLFALFVNWWWLLGTVPLAILAWHSLRWGGLALIPVGLLSHVFMRPWTSWVVRSMPLILVAWGLLAQQPWPTWIGVAWYVVMVPLGLWMDWCLGRVKRELGQDEALFVGLYHSWKAGIELKGGERVMRPIRQDTITEYEKAMGLKR